MATTAAQKTFPKVPVLIASAVAIALAAGVVYLNRPVARPSESGASAEAKAYLPNLELSNMSMKATENFMKQQVVEVEGDIKNNGQRALQSVEVYCLFYGGDGHEVYRERVPIIPPKTSSLKPGQLRHFRLPFDTLPDAWNQAQPKMVIAQITFAR